MSSVLEMALEALKYHREQTRAIALSDTAIFALEEAIKNQGEPVRGAYFDGVSVVLCAIGHEHGQRLYTSAPVKQQGEPVAWLIRGWRGYEDNATDSGLTAELAKSQGATVTPLYTFAPTIPAGWQLVPVEPTLEMLDAGDQYMGGLSSLGEAWGAMLSAAPKGEQP